MDARDIQRLTSLPRLQPDEWARFIKKTKLKKQDVARMMCIEPESLSRILKGKPCSVAAEKLFRMIVVDGMKQPMTEQFGALKAICALHLSSVELVK